MESFVVAALYSIYFLRIFLFLPRSLCTALWLKNHYFSFSKVIQTIVITVKI